MGKTRFPLTMTQEQRETLQQAADALGMSLSSFLIQSAFQAKEDERNGDDTPPEDFPPEVATREIPESPEPETPEEAVETVNMARVLSSELWETWTDALIQSGNPQIRQNGRDMKKTVSRLRNLFAQEEGAGA